MRPDPRAALAALCLLIGACASAPQAAPAPTSGTPSRPAMRQPAPPYFSVQLGTYAFEDAALQALAPLRQAPYARAELRNSGFILRVGAFSRREDAQAALPALREHFAAARVVQMQNPAEWLLADGSRAAPWGSALPPAELAQPLPAPPPPPPAGAVRISDIYRARALRLDAELRRLLQTQGPARRDGYLYGSDLAPLLLYAAERGDVTLYQQLLPAARKLIVLSDDDPFARGFVLWRHKDGAGREVSGASETAWMARALWTGARAFGRDEDRALAQRVLDGYAQHAYELQRIWLVRKYFAFASRSFAAHSVLSGYQPDFLAEAEAVTQGRPAWLGFAERSYALLGRAVSPARLLYPLIQPEIGATYPGLGLEVHGPNGLTALGDSCEAADAAIRGAPALAHGVLDFATDRAGRNRYGRLLNYHDGARGTPIGDAALSASGYACLGRLAAALGDQGAWDALEPQLVADLDPPPTVALSSEAPLYAAGPQLRAALATGVFAK